MKSDNRHSINAIKFNDLPASFDPFAAVREADGAPFGDVELAA
jgi:hypothetical protein